MMSANGADENKAADVIRFANRVFLPIMHDHGEAVLPTDHDSKAAEGSRYSRGSTSKLGKTDVMIKLIALSRSAATATASCR